MTILKKFLNEVYMGIYYHSINHEPIDTAKGAMGMRMMATVFLYYASLEMLLISIYVKIFGGFHLSVIGAFFLAFGIFFVLYSKGINPLIDKEHLDQIIGNEERRKLIKKSLATFIGGLVVLAFSFYLVVLIKRN